MSPQDRLTAALTKIEAGRDRATMQDLDVELASYLSYCLRKRVDADGAEDFLRYLAA